MVSPNGNHCGNIRAVDIVSRKALLRIAIGIPVTLGFLWAIIYYMCRCSGTGRRALDNVAISENSLRAHVQLLAGELGEHNLVHPQQLKRAADYLERTWRDQGYDVARQTYTVDGQSCANLEVSRRGKTKPGEIILIGAHYDSVESCPGANDNGSGVASMLEISRVFATLAPERTVRFVAFVNEEPPYFETDNQGSRVYAKMARQRGDDIRVMLSLETMGYYSDVPGSQQYPKPFNLFYPDRGNFIGFISNFKSRAIMQDAVRSFRARADFPVECCATFERIEGVNWSDHASFWHEGYRAFMVSDTAIFRYPHYHMAADTPEKLNYPALARVTEGLCGVVATLAEMK